MWATRVLAGSPRGPPRAALPTLVVLLAARAVAGEAASPQSAAESAWTLGASLFWYVAPGARNFWVVNASADSGPIHVEFRYHDEAIGTASALIGWNLEAGDTVRFGATPSVGCLVGDEGGPIFGLDVSLAFGPISFSSQNEWLWEIQKRKGWFFYAWTELDVRPWPWMRAGVVAERTRLFHTAREVIFGPLLGFSAWKVDVSFYWFKPGGIDQTFAVKLEMSL